MHSLVLVTLVATSFVITILLNTIIVEIFGLKLLLVFDAMWHYIFGIICEVVIRNIVEETKLVINMYFQLAQKFIQNLGRFHPRFYEKMPAVITESLKM